MASLRTLLPLGGDVCPPNMNKVVMDKSSLRMKDSESQIGVLEMKDSECQAIERTSAEVQTLNLETQHLILAECDEKSLGEFLTRITPALLKELDKNLRSNVFQDYDLINDESTELLNAFVEIF
uniref:Uncharacterized protein n=1 Tax=Strigamia maritima TaxID=126957 RepID=T1J7H2_STRMM